MTLAFAIVVSTFVSLTVTPMICAHFVRSTIQPDVTWLDRVVEGVLGALTRLTPRSLDVVLRHRG